MWMQSWSFRSFEVAMICNEFIVIWNNSQELTHNEIFWNLEVGRKAAEKYPPFFVAQFQLYQIMLH